MGAPVPDMNPAEDPSAEALLGSLRTIAAAERRKHASVLNYWLSIRGSREFPPIRDLDPLEISDAGAFSVLLEMIGAGEDAEIRHIGQAIKGGVEAEKIGEAPSPSLLSCIAARLPVVAACREAFAFEDSFEGADGKTKCWVTLLPFSATGTWIDYVYGFVSLDPAPGAAETVEAVEKPVEAAEEPDEISEQAPIEPVDAPADPDVIETAAVRETAEQTEPEPETVASPPSESAGKAGFSKKFFESLANVGGFYGRPTGIELDPDTVQFETNELPESEFAEEPEVAAEASEEPESAPEPEGDEAPAEAEEPLELDEPETDMPAEATLPPEAEEPAEPAALEPSIQTPEGALQNKLTDVRAKADEARQAKLRANAALYDGLSAAYDFALDAEDAPEEYLRLVEAEGLKIQLRSPMKPVAKLAFDGMCDEMTIKQLEAVLAWAFDEELPRGTLAERIEEAGGIASILSGQAKAA
jgi:hypothetical protein